MVCICEQVSHDADVEVSLSVSYATVYYVMSTVFHFMRLLVFSQEGVEGPQTLNQN